MADYYPLIARAISGLDPSAPGESRRALYERARAALIAQLRSVQPPLSESEITRERLSLGEAVREVEAEAAPPPLRAPAPAPAPAMPPAPPPAPLRGRANRRHRRRAHARRRRRNSATSARRSGRKKDKISARRATFAPTRRRNRRRRSRKSRCRTRSCRRPANDQA